MLLPPRLLVALVVALVAAATLSAPAGAELGPNGRPGQTGPITIVGASTSGLELTFDPVEGADYYIVETSTNPALTDRKVAIPHTTSTRVWVHGLAAGQMYCLSVHGVNAQGNGKRGPRACHPTIIAQGASAGPTYKVVTYNVCSASCSRWAKRKGKAAGLVKATDPDVVGLQEDKNKSKMPKLLKGSLAKAAHHGLNTLLYRKGRFDVVRSGYLKLKADRREAVWAELADRSAGGKRVLFVNTHLTDGRSSAHDAQRATNMARLLAGVNKVNSGNVPVVYMGDMNSMRRRTPDVPGQRFNAAGYYDAFDLAMTLTRPNANSYNGFRSGITIGRLYGDHVDHFFVRPGGVRVLNWTNAAYIGDQLVQPFPSDHNPLAITLQVN